MCDDCEDISYVLTFLSAEIQDMANLNVIDPEGDVILICGEKVPCLIQAPESGVAGLQGSI